jgi:hypothetical protein
MPQSSQSGSALHAFRQLRDWRFPRANAGANVPSGRRRVYRQFPDDVAEQFPG